MMNRIMGHSFLGYRNKSEHPLRRAAFTTNAGPEALTTILKYMVSNEIRDTLFHYLPKSLTICIPVTPLTRT
jgi:hypothetical protein